MSESLLAVLATHANSRGIVLVAEEALVREANESLDHVTASLRRLERAGLLEILAPLPYLVLRLRTWPGKRPDPHRTGASAYSSSKLLSQSQRLNSGYRPPSERHSVDPQLLEEILETLGESDGASFSKAVELYSPHVIRLALDRVRRARGIRKSRTALFRHLLPRLARHENRFQ
ncbi:MAG: hypothetical protein IT348_17755 [Candidatus Eisenbacteria bacterium]|nr:hypothetical protein [Candidatus Eisenbacteria bacterium]